jgi:molecular chaperone HtpG
MNLPPKLEELLKKDSSLYGSVLVSYAEFDPWLRASGTPFFPEYTDHSAKHIREVLQTASSLIHDESWSVLTPSDSGLLCLAALLHDCAMHLTEDGFLCLLHDSTWQMCMHGETPWPEMWAEFLAEASRFDGRK